MRSRALRVQVTREVGGGFSWISQHPIAACCIVIFLKDRKLSSGWSVWLVCGGNVNIMMPFPLTFVTAAIDTLL
jgi:hypothetical protein